MSKKLLAELPSRPEILSRVLAGLRAKLPKIDWKTKAIDLDAEGRPKARGKKRKARKAKTKRTS